MNYTEMMEKIHIEFEGFKRNTDNPNNKAAAKRARKNAMELRGLFKEFRKLSIK